MSKDDHDDDLVGTVGQISGRLGTLEDNFKTHRTEMREDIRNGFQDLGKTLNGKIEEISDRYDHRLDSCNQTHETQIRQAHGRIKGVDEKISAQGGRISQVEKHQGKLLNWKHYVAGAVGAVIVLPPAVKAIWELIQVVF